MQAHHNEKIKESVYQLLLNLFLALGQSDLSVYEKNGELLS